MPGFPLRCLAVLAVVVTAFGTLRADTLRTMDGKQYEGLIRVDPSVPDALVMQQSVGSAVRVKLEEVLDASFSATTGATTRASAAGRQLVEPIRGPWTLREVGEMPQGTIRRTATRVTLASGYVRESRDRFSFFAQTQKGDFEIVCKVTDVPVEICRGGLMVRSSQDPDSPFVAVYTDGINRPNGNRAVVCVRTAKGQNIRDDGFIYPTGNAYLKLRREGDVVAAFASADGVDWKPGRDWHVDFPNEVVVGVFSSGHLDNNDIPKNVFPEAKQWATFDSLRVSPYSAPVGTGLRAEYFQGSQDFKPDDKPIAQRVDATLDMNWGDGSPAPGVPKDKFRARWGGELRPPVTGKYRFYGSPGVGLWINGRRLFRDGGAGEIELKGSRSAAIRVQYRHNDGAATVKLEWEAEGVQRQVIPTRQLFPSQVVGAGEVGLRGEYFSDQELTNLIAVRVDPEINFNTDSSPVDPTLTSFSVRWTGMVVARSTGRYTFSTFADDGIRLWVNNQQLVDNWKLNPGAQDGGSIDLDAGVEVPIRIESFNGPGNWAAQLFWEGPGIDKQIVPAGSLLPPRQVFDTRVVTRDGSELTKITLQSMDETTLRIKTGSDESLSLPVDRVSRLSLRPLTRQMQERIASGTPGVLLTSGDFFEAQVEKLADGTLSTNSMIFGPRQFKLASEVAAVVLQDVKPEPADFIVRGGDGSVYMSKTVTTDSKKSVIVVDDRAVGKVNVPLSEVRQVRYTGDRVASLTSIPATVSGSNALVSAGDSMKIDATTCGLPAELLGAPIPQHLVGLAASTAATYALDGKYKSLICKIGVPSGLLPTGHVMFIISTDGKELFRSDPLTSVDDAIDVNLKVAGAKSLKLAVEQCGEGLPLSGVWGDPLLTKP